MKKTILMTAVFGSIALAVGSAHAGHHEGKQHASVAETFASIDANSDGEVTEAEYLAHKRAKYEAKGKTVSAEKEAKMSAWFAEMSGDDGALTLAEMEASDKAHRAEMKAKKKDKKS